VQSEEARDAWIVTLYDGDSVRNGAAGRTSHGGRTGRNEGRQDSDSDPQRGEQPQLEGDDAIQASEVLSALKEAMLDVYEFDPLVMINMFHLQSSETLKSLSPDLLESIRRLSDTSIETMTGIFRNLLATGKNIVASPLALSQITWSLFSGVVLWEESKKVFNERKDFLKQTLDIAFEILERGMKTAPESAMP